jgi:hypothetical protein
MLTDIGKAGRATSAVLIKASGWLYSISVLQNERNIGVIPGAGGKEIGSRQIRSQEDTNGSGAQHCQKGLAVEVKQGNYL